MGRCKYKYITGTTLLFLILGSCESKRDSWSISSPDKRIEAEIFLDDQSGQGSLHYSLYYKLDGHKVQVIKPSVLGIEREDARFADNLHLLSVNVVRDIQESYQLLSGGWSEYSSRYNEIELSFASYENNQFSVVMRVSDQGLAFRYGFRQNHNTQLKVVNELTTFHLGEGKFWAHPYDAVTMYSPAYETYYNGPMTIGTESPEDKNGWAFPLLFETGKCWVLITESGFDGSYGASHLSSSCEDGIYRVEPALGEEAMGYYENRSHGISPWWTAWRIITVGDSPGDILESHMVTDLAEDSKIQDTDWIKTGRASWSWWSDSDSPQDINDLKVFVDLAAEMGWEYSLVDANWNRMKDGSLDDLAGYAAAKNVGLLLWYNSGGIHNVVQEAPRDLMDRSKVRRQEFEHISSLGIKGVKVDFFQSDKQELINRYLEILQDAADYRLLVNFHGCTLPRGWRRTYPNLVSMEAIRGCESYKYDPDFPETAPRHLTIFPFTRGVVGPTDYTPGGFSNSTYPHLTTFGFELALPVIIENGIIHYAEKPGKINELPSFVKDILKELPAAWDDTRYIYGYPGKEAVIARKKDDTWYVAGINGENIRKNIAIDLGKIYDAKGTIFIIEDGDSNADLVSRLAEPGNSILEINLKPYGGFLCKIAKP